MQKPARGRVAEHGPLREAEDEGEAAGEDERLHDQGCLLVMKLPAMYYMYMFGFMQ